MKLIPCHVIVGALCTAVLLCLLFFLLIETSIDYFGAKKVGHIDFAIRETDNRYDDLKFNITNSNLPKNTDKVCYDVKYEGNTVENNANFKYYAINRLVCHPNETPSVQRIAINSFYYWRPKITLFHYLLNIFKLLNA